MSYCDLHHLPDPEDEMVEDDYKTNGILSTKQQNAAERALKSMFIFESASIKK
jgi:hypothetical protein